MQIHDTLNTGSTIDEGSYIDISWRPTHKTPQKMGSTYFTVDSLLET